jgi:hypothetical protein
MADLGAGVGEGMDARVTVNRVAVTAVLTDAWTRRLDRGLNVCIRMTGHGPRVGGVGPRCCASAAAEPADEDDRTLGAHA